MSPLALFYLLLSSPVVFERSSSNRFINEPTIFNELVSRFSHSTPFTSSEWTSFEPKYTSILRKAISKSFVSERSVLGEIYGSRHHSPIFSGVYTPEVEIMRHVLSSRVNPETRYLIKKVLRNVETVNPVLLHKVIRNLIHTIRPERFVVEKFVRRIVKNLKHNVPTRSILSEIFPYTPYTPYYTPEEFSFPVELFARRAAFKPTMMKKIIEKLVFGGYYPTTSIYGRRHFSVEKLIRKLVKKSIKRSIFSSRFEHYSYPVEKVILKLIKRSIFETFRH